MPVRSRTAALLLATATLTAGCTASMDGSASMAAGPAPEAGPPTDVLGTSALDIEPDFSTWDLAAHPEGHFVVLLGADYASDHSLVTELVPGDDGPTLRNTLPIPPFDDDGFLSVTPDGTVLATGTTWFDGREGIGVYALGPGADEAEELYGFGEEDEVDVSAVALSPDGSTLYVGYLWYDGWETLLPRVRVIDVETGEMVTDQEVSADAPGGADLTALAVRPDGGVSVLLTAGRTISNQETGAFLVEYDDRLRPLAKPIDLVRDTHATGGRSLVVTEDGDVLVRVYVGPMPGPQAHLLTVRDGAVSETLPPAAGSGAFALGADGDQVHVLAPNSEGPGALTTLDRATGETAAEAPMCTTGGSFAHLAVAADGRSVAVLGSCAEDGDVATAFLVG